MSMIGMTIGSVAVVATFLLLLFVHDVINEEEHSHHMLLLFFYNLFLCSYLSGADKVTHAIHVHLLFIMSKINYNLRPSFGLILISKLSG